MPISYLCANCFMPNGAHREYCSNNENKKEWETSMDYVIKISVLETRIAELESALKSCHILHNSPYTCADVVDKYYHKLFP
jgi:hypothetical protein